MHNLFLTGEIGIGKSTILKDILERVNSTIGGYITERDIQDNIMTFTTRSLYNGGEEYTIAKVNRMTKSKEVFVDAFEIGLKSVLDNSLKGRDLIVLDELGFMEENIEVFTSKVEELLDSEIPILGVLKDHNCKFLNNIRNRDDVIVIEITKENRNAIIYKLISILKSFGLEFKRRNSFMWSEDKINWYNSALEEACCGYPHPFIEEIKKHVGSLEGKTILDIGAGTGAFSIPLMKEGAEITAIDSSFNMLDSLSKRAKEKHLKNYKSIIGPFQKIDLEKHDIAISAFSESSTTTFEGIKKMVNLVKYQAFIISSFEKHENNFNIDILYSMLNRPPKTRDVINSNLGDTLKILDTKGYTYDYKEIEYEFSQYFNDYNDSLEFLINRYNIKGPIEIVRTKEFINKYLIKTGKRYKLKNIKKSYLISVKAKV